MATKIREVSVGVLLDDDPKLRESLAHADNIDYVIEPRTVDELLDYLVSLTGRGRRIRTLLLTGHGRAKQHKIGMLQPRDVDLDWVRRRREASYGNRLDASRQIARLTRRLNSTDDDAKRAALRDNQLDQQGRLAAASAEYAAMTRREQAFQDIEDLMLPGATIGLLNCYADADPEGRRFVEHIGRALLHKRGGRVLANSGLIGVAKIQPVLAWLTGQPDHLIFPLGEWASVEQAASGRSGRRCGVPCADFSRYGLCDHPAGKDGGPCFQHR